MILFFGQIDKSHFLSNTLSFFWMRNKVFTVKIQVVTFWLHDLSDDVYSVKLPWAWFSTAYVSVDSLPAQMMTFIRNRQTKWISREFPILTNHFQEGIHLAEVSVFDRMTGKNRHFRNLSQQVLSGIVDPSTPLASTPYVALPTLKLKIAEFDD